jgi:hypothetical protein
VEVAHLESDDLGRPQPGQAQAQHQLVAPADLPVPGAGAEQPPEGLVVGEPAGRMLGLDLAVEAGDPA